MRLLEIRELKKKSQKQVATFLKISQQAYSRYERGEREADYSTLIQLANYFDVSLDYLLERTNDVFFIDGNIKQKSEIQEIYDNLPKMEQAQVLGFAKGLLKGIEKIKKLG